MRRTALLIPLCLLAACGAVPKTELDAELARRDSQLNDLKSYCLDVEAENSSLRDQIRGLQDDIDTALVYGAGQASAEIDRVYTEIEAALRNLGGTAVGGGGAIEYLRVPEGEVVRITDGVLFSSGSAVLSKEGRAIIADIAAEIADTENAIRVEGHTDSDPVKKNAARFPHGNMQLAAARAVEVAAILVEAGIPSDRVTVAGYGAAKPLLENSSAENKARNRRVEILLLSGQ